MAVNGRGFQQRLQNFYLTWSAQPREMTILLNCDAGRIITTVFKRMQARDQDFPDITSCSSCNYSTH